MIHKLKVHLIETETSIQCFKPLCYTASWVIYEVESGMELRNFTSLCLLTIGLNV